MEERSSLMRMEAEISAILAMLQEVKEQTVGKVYNTQELCEYLKVGKAVIDKLRQDGELEFSKLGGRLSILKRILISCWRIIILVSWRNGRKIDFEEGWQTK